MHFLCKLHGVDYNQEDRPEVFMKKENNLLKSVKAAALRFWGYVRKHKIVSSIIFIAVIIISFIAISGARARANAASSYQTTTVEEGNLNATIGATGNVRALQTAILSWGTTVNGTIGSIDVQPGDMAAQSGTGIRGTHREAPEPNPSALQYGYDFSGMPPPSWRSPAQADIVDAQIALNNLNYWQNQV
jgi:hypothetical protein